MTKTLTRKYLDSFGWFGIRVGGHVVAYCDRCLAQHSHSCVNAAWDDVYEDFVYTFECINCEADV